ncbi:MAG: membrane protein insertase YidC [Schwartzia sp.]|nr:membrane protein insertase YidC [Schwartzia sp. (in: firmicutes)]
MEALYSVTVSMGVPSYGLAIIFLTIIIKMLLYPLTVKQVKSMKAMQELQPKMKRIQEDYKTNPQLMQQEMQKLYSEAGVNPLAGCLPLLVQMPFLMAIFYALRDAVYEGNPAFLWMPSLSESDPYYIMPVLSALSTYLVSRQSMDQSNSQTKMMGYIMPLIIGYMSMQFASGLVLYWVTMNTVQIGQQWWMFRNDEKPQKKAKEKKNKKADAGSGTDDGADEAQETKQKSKKHKNKK